MEDILKLIPSPAYIEAIWGDGTLVKLFGYKVKEGVDINRTTGGGGFRDNFTIANGKYKGKTIKWLYQQKRDYFGTSDELRWETLPVTMGVCYACQDLSIQVHPREDWAMQNLGIHGKSECWYFVDCPEDATVVMGHNARNISEFDEYIEKKDWEGLVKRYQIKPGDFYAIKAGTLHSIQKGSYFIEVSNPCPVTYRLFDYDRLDYNGQKRPLEIDKVRQNILIPFEEIKYERKTSIFGDVEETFLADNEDYSVWTYKVKGEGIVKRKKPFAGCYVIEGSGNVGNIEVHAGESFFVTRQCTSFKLSGDMTVLCCNG